MLLSILIASIPRRADLAATLYRKIESQIGTRAVEVLMLTDNCQRSIGEKRNALVAAAKGQYCCFVDDDDDVADDYVATLYDVLERRSPDAVSLGMLLSRPAGKVLVWLGLVVNRGRQPALHLARLNHLCPVRTAVVRQVPFANTNFGEDRDWSERVAPLIHHVEHTRRVLYFANYDPQQSASRGLGQYADAADVWREVFRAYADEQPESEPSRQWAVQTIRMILCNDVGTIRPRILDVGCGRGDVVHRLRYWTRVDVEGLDAVDLGTVRPFTYADLATRDGAHWLRQTGQRGPWDGQKGPWDVASCVHVLEHLPEWEISSVHYSLAQIARRAVVAVSLAPWNFNGRELRKTVWPAERWHDELVERWHVRRYEHDGAAARFELASREWFKE